MADKQKENKQAPDQSEPMKSEKSEKSSSITSPKPVTLPVAKTPIQACFLEFCTISQSDFGGQGVISIKFLF